MNRTLWPILLGFSLWATGFVALYAVQHLGCFWGWPPAVHRTVLVLFYAAGLAALGALLIRQRQTAGSHLGAIAVTLTVAALAASAITFAPALFISACL